MVALGTVLFGDPGAPARVRSELAAEARARRLATPADAARVALAAVGNHMKAVEKPLEIG
jgi:hypothetical protein